MILCLSYFTVPQVHAENFRLTRDVSLEYAEDKPSFYLHVDGAPTKSRISTSHWMYEQAPSSGKRFRTDPVHKWLKVTGGYVEKNDKEKVSEYETTYQYLDGTNALVYTEITYQSDEVRVGAGLKFLLYIKGMPKETKVEILSSDGKLKSFQPLNQEVAAQGKSADMTIKDSRKVTVSCGPLFAIIEPGKDTKIEVVDTRTKDAGMEAISFGAMSTLGGPYQKGTKRRVEMKVQLSKRK